MPSRHENSGGAAQGDGGQHQYQDWRHQAADDRYQAPFSLASPKVARRGNGEGAEEDPLSEPEHEGLTIDTAVAAAQVSGAGGKADLVPSSPYFDDKESAEAFAWIQSGGRKEQEAQAQREADEYAAAEDGGEEGDSGSSQGISIRGKLVGRKRRDSQVGSYNASGSIFDGPSAGAIPSSISS